MNKRRRFKAKRRRSGRMVPLTGILMRRDAFDVAMKPLADEEYVQGLLKRVEPFTIKWRPDVEQPRRYEADGAYWRPLTVSESLERHADQRWLHCRVVGGEICVFDGLAPQR